MSQNTNKAIKSVSFNIKVPTDADMLKYVKRRNFSGYVKKLILADMKKNAANGNQVEEVIEAPTPIVKKTETAAERLDRMKKQKSEPKPTQAPLINLPKS